MRRIHQLSFGLALLVALSVGSVTTFAKSGAKRRIITGQVLSVQHDERTFILREIGSGKMYRVQAPAGSMVRNNLSGALVNFEQLLPGTLIRDLTVE